jgi:ABC-type thiamin/hydroxymethylpyrimidine transport system permease subunit
MSRLRREFAVFPGCSRSMRILLVSTMIYALVLPVIEMFVAAYVMRNSHSNLNYYYVVELFSSALTAVLVPALVGWFIVGAARYGWSGGRRQPRLSLDCDPPSLFLPCSPPSCWSRHFLPQC